MKHEKRLIINQTVKKIKGNEYKDVFRLKLRSYKVFYKKIYNELIILVLRVRDRKDIYK
ncbi:type II toxin-antitoxin system RelE family toxin [Campylobacter ureolyticus]|uniref:type II toxin-antitoxin system RelE family toxin n=1 Tax=Campylobacter ureolyticus TaxID=827 RepID=UPI000E209187|nr:type II toxin-antitoxin system RelE/ParE family toxin [Campylobacter ureolyticus]